MVSNSGASPGSGNRKGGLWSSSTKWKRGRGGVASSLLLELLLVSLNEMKYGFGLWIIGCHAYLMAHKLFFLN